MTDVVLVTADSVRYDGRAAMPTVAAMDTKLGVTGGHYTRPSLASLLAASYEAAVRAEAVSPTLPEVLAEAGYTCIGRAPSPQLDAVFGFDAGFDDYENYFDAGNRGSRRREVLGRIGPLRRIYHRLFPPHAKMDELPTDEAVVDEAVAAFNDADGPRFLWAHLMGSHRPYGRGKDAISRSLDRRALFAPDRLTPAQHEEILTKYEAAIGRVDDRIDRLLSELDADDPIVVFASDHGDEHGEEGYYFHQPQRQRVAEALVEVPVGFDGIDVPGERLSLLDVAPTLVDALDLSVPAAWHGHSLFQDARDQTVTVAPWHNSATVLWQDFRTRLVASDAAVSLETATETVGVDESDVPEALQDQLRDLGYVG